MRSDASAKFSKQHQENFQRGRTIHTEIAGTSVKKYINTSKKILSQIMTAYLKHIHTTSTKRNSCHKLKLTNRDLTYIPYVCGAKVVY